MSPRNEFEQNIPLEEEEKEVPLTLGVGGPAVGTVRLTKDGAVIGEITDENLREKMQGDLSVFSIGHDPAARYRSKPLPPPIYQDLPEIDVHQDEMDVPYGRPPQQ